MRHLGIGIASLLVSISAGAQGDLDFRLETSKNKYLVGERIIAIFSLKNKSEKALKVTHWRGPTAGVSLLDGKGSTKDFAVIGPDGKPLRYQGFFSDAISETYFALAPGETHISSWTLNGIPFAAYDFSSPGTYVLKSVYPNPLAPAPDVRITIVPPSESDLARNRSLASSGDLAAIQFLATNRDPGAIPAFEAVSPSADLNYCLVIAKALSLMGTDEAVKALGRLVMIVKESNRRVFLDALGDSKNPLAIPILKEYLTVPDNNVSEITDIIGGRRGKTTVIRLNRRAAANALRKFSIDIPDSVWKMER